MTIAAAPSAPRNVRYRASYVDTYRALRAIDRFVPLSRRMRQIGLGMFALGVALIVLGLAMPSRWRAFASIALFLLFFPLIFFPLKLLLPAYMAWLTRRKSALWSGEQELTFDDAGIRSRGGAFSGFLRWDAIVRVEETRRFVLFFTSAQCACFFPKKALPSAESARELAEFVRARAGKPVTSDGNTDRRSSFNGVPRVTSVFEIDALELSRATMQTIRRRGTLLLWPWYLLMIALVSWTTVPTVYRQWSDGGWAAVNITTLIIGVLPLAMVLVAAPLAARYAARRQKRTSPSSAGPQTIEVYDEGIQTRGALYTGEFPWAILQRVEETDEFLLFSISTVQVLYLPKRTLDAEGLGKLRTIVRSGLGPRARLLG